MDSAIWNRKERWCSMEQEEVMILLSLEIEEG